MELVTPNVGTIFWMLLFFSLVLFILGKFAWKPVLNTIKEREQTINEALQSAERTKLEMAKLKADNDKILDEARNQRDVIMREAKIMKDKIIQDAQEHAQAEAKKIVESARASIDNEKKAAIHEIKTQIAVLSVSIAEKIIREKLDASKQTEIIDKLLSDVKLG